MNNAFTMARVLADVSTGLSPNRNYTTATPEYAKINTIADILAYCVNSTGGISGDGSACGNLFANTTPSPLPTGGAAPQDTIQAAWYMAQNPILNVSTLYGYASSNPPFVGLTSAPTDWTVAVNFAPTASATYGVAAPHGIAIDAYGDAWLSNNGGLTSTVTGITSPAASAAELGPDGNLLVPPVIGFTASTTGGAAAQFTGSLPTAARTFTTPQFVAVDLTNNTWVRTKETRRQEQRVLRRRRQEVWRCSRVPRQPESRPRDRQVTS